MPPNRKVIEQMAEHEDSARSVSVGGAMADTPRKRCCYLTPHEMRRLDWSCRPIAKWFGDCPYLVGSVMQHDNFRDIDIRLILPDEVLTAMTFGSQEVHFLMNAAFTSLIESMANMRKPIDFQFQSASEAATEDGPRNPLGMR